MTRKITKYKSHVRQANVLFLDIEVSPTLGWSYGQYNTNVIKVELPPVLLSFSWKWLGDDCGPKCLTIVDEALPDKTDHRLLVQKLWELLDEASVVVTHNIDFDVKMANAFFIRCGLKPPKPYKTVCTLKLARGRFKFDCNKLDYLCGLLFDEHKTEITNNDVWHQILYGDKKTRKRCSNLLKEYNNQDVALLEKLYLRMLPYTCNHPNLSLLIGKSWICPLCGHEAEFRVKAYRTTGAQVNGIQCLCSHCGGYVTRKLTKEERQELSELGELQSTFRILPA